MIWNPALTKFNKLRSLTETEIYRQRGEFNPQFAWSVPQESTANAIKAVTSQIVEIGAGTGYWARYLSQFGIVTYAYDIKPYHNNWCWAKTHWHEVKMGDHKMIGKHKQAALMLCWPPYNEDLAYNALRYFRRWSSNDYVIYIGEGHGGCTADDKFHNYLDKHFDMIYDVPSINWSFIRSSDQLWRRK